MTPDEMRHELLSLIQGWPATVRQKTPPERLKGIGLTQATTQVSRIRR